MFKKCWVNEMKCSIGVRGVKEMLKQCEKTGSRFSRNGGGVEGGIHVVL